MLESRFSSIPYSQHWFQSLKVALEFFMGLWMHGMVATNKHETMDGPSWILEAQANRP
jgi:hypothetical protein